MELCRPARPAKHGKGTLALPALTWWIGYWTSDGSIYQNLVSSMGVVETPAGTNAYAIVSLYDDRIEIDGRGVVEDRTLPVMAVSTAC
eukprot:105515-Pyramimonas_sp.AAC.1